MQFNRIKISDYHTKFSKYKYRIIMTICIKLIISYIWQQKNGTGLNRENTQQKGCPFETAF